MRHLRLFEELQRRNVFRVGVAYVVSCWLLAQVADLVLDNIGAPAWVMQSFLLIMGLGLPVVLFFSWAYEVTPEGIKRESDIDRSRSTAQVTGRKLDRAIMAVLVLAVAYFALDKFYLYEVGSTKTGADTEAGTGLAGKKASASIAVLPFVNMSDDAGNEYFSEGLSEELLNLLAKNPDLRVAARTSSFSFKDQALEISEIARRLSVAYVLEGSVRRAGDQIRITAQLIKADDGYHLWSDTYDRRLDNIFAVQDEIAGRITAALLPQIIAGDTSPAGASGYTYTPPAAVYERYLLARSLFNKQTSSDYKQALEILTPLVRENPGYAEAQALYAHVMYFSSARTSGDVPWIIAEAQVKKGIREALALNPRLAEAYLVEGRLKQRSWDLAGAISAYEKAIELSPSYADAYTYLAGAAMTAGLEARTWEALDRARELDPLSTTLLTGVAKAGLEFGRPADVDNAIALLNQLNPELASETQIAAYRETGQLAREIVALERHLSTYPDSASDKSWLANLYARIGMVEEAIELSPQARLIIAAEQGHEDEALQLMEKLAAGVTDPHDRADLYWMVYFLLGQYDKALDVMSDLWYGYAEEQLGPRMDGLDVTVFGLLLRRAGREDEARAIAAVLTNDPYRAHAMRDAGTLLLEGRDDEAMQSLEANAAKGGFGFFFIRPYAWYVGLEQQPGFPALLARAEASRAEDLAAYRALKAAQ